MKRFGIFGLDTGNERLLRGSTPIALPPKPYAVLRYLVEHPGRLITHDELLEALWPETYVQPQVLRTYMLDLRKALNDDAGQPQFIQTVPKRGYRFLACVTESANGIDNATAEAAHTPPVPQGAPNSVPQLRPAAGIVNRHAELENLASHFASACAGTRQVAFITGEAGIGKTALLDAFCAQLRSATIARGQCVDGLSRKEQFYPVTEALGHLCASEDGEKACKILARMAPDWLAAMGRESPANSIQTGQRERMPGDLCAALEELAGEKPLVLVLEDLQWADDSTLHLVSALARRRAPARLMVIATYRPQHVAADHPLRELKQDLRMRRLCTELTLAPLARNAVRELIKLELLGRELEQSELPPGLIQFVHRRSEGNPLFVIAILEHLIAQQYLIHDSAIRQWRWLEGANPAEMEAGVPEGLAQMIEVEIARLSEQEQRMLEGASLMNFAFTTWAVAAALELDPAETEEAFQELARRLYFVERAGQDELPDGTDSTFYVFAHGLYREVLWQRQTEAKRARRHIRIAERLAKLFEGREGNVAREMAIHYEAAGNWPRAIASLRAAASHALDRRAHAEAAELLDHALQLTDRLREPEREQCVRDLSLHIQSARHAVSQSSEKELLTSTKA